MIVSEIGVFVEVTFDGKGPFVMKHDTGAPSSWLDTTTAKRFGVAAGERSARVGELDLGPQRVDLIDWPGAQHTYPGMPGPVVGVVGNAFFEGFAVGLDLRGEELWLYPNDGVGAFELPPKLSPSVDLIEVPMTRKEGYLLVRCGFRVGDGEDCLFDTGAVFSVALEAYFNRKPAPDGHAVPLFTVDSHGKPLLGHYRRAEAVTMGQLAVAGDVISVFPEFALLSAVGDHIGAQLVGLVGIHSLLGHFVIIDYARDRLVLYPDGDRSHVPASPFVGYGFVAQGAGAALRVAAVVEGSKAASAGVEPGDLLQTVDGKGLAQAGIELTVAALIAGKPGARRTFGFARDGAAVTLELEAEDLLPPLR